jgi:uncharacterized protein (DUF433 family)
LAADISIIAHLEDYTDLEREDIQAGLFCAAHLIEKERIYTIAK